MKISHNKKRFHPTDGTVYRQTLTVTPEEYEAIDNHILAEIATGLPRFKEYIETGTDSIYMKALHPCNNVVYLNLTQARYIKLICSAFLIGKLTFKLDRNTLILIK